MKNKIKILILVILVAGLSSIITYKLVIKKEKKEDNKQIKLEQNKEQQIDKNQNIINETEKNNIKEKEELKQPSTTTEEEVIDYFRKEETFLIENKESINTISKIKESFQTLYDFIFNEKQIKGYTFNELTTSAKLKILKIALSIDNKIDNYFPEYKENIKDKYITLKEKVINKYLEITAEVCTSNEELCKTASQDFETMKESYKLTISTIKDVVSKGSEKLKQWWSSR